ncbi:type III secretion system protein PrgH [Lactococcus petauri]|uniref:type III secretion system protein PrgH n=1 Tax=Lactococcus petauri TaxID=1940789 RepID=UPI0018AB058B|nr:type III secretion system protein PrgH [Lactococcus petauri]MDC0826546.1 type III secretion system protein PrgH [Lactococcus petauri]
MNIDDETLSQVLSSLKDYNPTANDLMEKLSTALVPVAMVVLGILMYMEYADLNRKLAVEQGRVNMELFISVAWKYMVAFVCVMASDKIIDSIVWLNSAAGWILDKVVPNKTMDNIEIKEVTKGLNWLQKGFISSMQGMTYFALWASEIITKVMNFLRFVTLFMIKGLAPMLFVFFVSDEWREIAKGFMKQLFAVVLQGLVLVLVLKLFPTIMTDDLIKVAASGHFEEALANIFLVFAKVIIFIITIVGSQRVAKQWIGAS